MGNVDSHDYLPVWDPEHKVLDLTHVLTYSDLNKHLLKNCEGKCLESLPNHILEEISLYERIIVSFNCLTNIPSALPLHLPHINHLDLSHNCLEELPNSLCLFFHLRILMLHHNQLTSLPNSFVNLYKLEKADISHNKLTQLPEDFRSLQELRKLNLSFNKLTILPKTLVECKNLKVILATGNECHTPPQEVCNLGSQEILKYMRKYFVLPAPDKRSEGNIFHRVRQNQLQSPSFDVNSTKVQYVQQKTDTYNVSKRVKTPLIFPPSATSYSLEDVKDKILGLIFGAVIGDSLGLATDLMSVDESHFHYDEDFLMCSEFIIDEHRLHWQRGQWTSCSDWMLTLLDSVIHWAGVVDELDFAQRLSNWKKYGLLNNNFPGYTTSKIMDEVLAKDDFVTAPHVTAVQFLQRHMNGSSNHTEDECLLPSIDSACLPPSVILGVLHFHNLTEVISNSVRICRATHADSRCIAASVAISCVVALLLQGKHQLSFSKEIEEIYELARLMAIEKLSDIEEIKQFNNCFSELNLEHAFHNDLEENHPFKTLQIALAALHLKKDYREVIPQIIMQGGPSTVRSCIAGAFMGCRVGFKQLPRVGLERLHPEQREWLDGKINFFLDMMGIP